MGAMLNYGLSPNRLGTKELSPRNLSIIGLGKILKSTYLTHLFRELYENS